jgi:3-oxoacyl-[acyl-carrier-protein] synthase II
MTLDTGFHISGLSVLSVAGIGSEALGRALRTSSAEASDTETSASGPAGHSLAAIPGRIAEVPGFDIADFVPKKGTKNLDRTTKLGIAASARLKQDFAGSEAAWCATGVAVGSMAGSLRSSIEFDASVLAGDGIDLVDPAAFPNTTMNCCASQIAIWHRMRGPNATLANGSLSALSATQYAARLIRRGHAERMAVGGVEELSPYTAWGIRLRKDVDGSAVIGEGAAMFLLEAARPGAAPGPATISACEVLFAPEHTEQGHTRALNRAVDRVLATSGLTGDDIALVLPGATGTCQEPSEAAVLDRFDAERVDVRKAVGECGSAQSAMQIAAATVLCAPGERVLITGLDVSGTVGAAVLTGRGARG